MHPETFLRVLGPEPYRVAYVGTFPTSRRRSVWREPEPTSKSITSFRSS